jgi:eukaryotic-like serine/threonine-protein kinase
MKFPDRYEATGVAGGGGMGEIHECIDRHLNRRVILKMLKGGEEDRRLLDEQKALIKIRSKHVVQLFDVVVVENVGEVRTALVLEHINGYDLKVGSLMPGELYLKTIWQVACGMHEIHQHNIIHRDIKPNNIRVDEGGVVKILDFGLARTSGLEAVTRSVIGTPGFMAPELWGSAVVSFDEKIDVYAFGMLALTLLDSTVPRELLNRPPMPLPLGSLNLLKASLPSDVVDVLEKCLSYLPVNRPTMSDVENVLRTHLLKGRHRGLIVLGQKTHEINMASPAPTVRYKKDHAIGIHYDGFTFRVANLEGEISVNNTTLNVGNSLPDCCVISLGPINDRSFATFDISNPEVMP